MSETNEKKEKKFKKKSTVKNLRRSETTAKIITEETQPKKNTIKEFEKEKLLITEPINLNKSQKNFLSPDKIKAGNV